MDDLEKKIERFGYDPRCQGVGSAVVNYNGEEGDYEFSFSDEAGKVEVFNYGCNGALLTGSYKNGAVSDLPPEFQAKATELISHYLKTGEKIELDKDMMAAKIQRTYEEQVKAAFGFDPLSPEYSALYDKDPSELTDEEFRKLYDQK